MMERRIYSVESPRTPPPSRERRQYPLLSSVRTGPVCSLGNVGIEVDMVEGCVSVMLSFAQLYVSWLLRSVDVKLQYPSEST